MTRLHPISLERFDVSRPAETLPEFGPLPEDPHPESAEPPTTAGDEPDSQGTGDSLSRLEGELRQAIDQNRRAEVLLEEAAERLCEVMRVLDLEFRRAVTEEVRRACQALLPRVTEIYLAEEVAHQLETLSRLPDGPLLMQVGNEALLAPMREALDVHLGVGRPIEVGFNPAIGRLGVQLQWSGGGIDFDYGRVLEALCAASGHETSAPIKTGDTDGGNSQDC